MVRLGSEIRRLHLLESPVLSENRHTFSGPGKRIVGKIGKNSWRGPVEKGGMFPAVGKVYISDSQYFSDVPAEAWEFYIGGYQPAQKWLKDRKGRELSFEDLAHYQKIIIALTETGRLMQEIDKINIESS